jgi:hypothetical protein
MHCGARRVDAVEQDSRPTLSGLGTGTLVSLLIGFGCLVAALVTGVIFSGDNIWDWQAVQAFRIEWLLAGIAFFLVAGVCALVRRRN